MNTIVLSVSYLRAALICAASKNIHYYLNGVLVRIRADDALIVSTDGHRLSVFRAARPDNAEPYTPAEIIIPRDAIKGIKAAKGAEACFLQYDAEKPLAECRLSGLKDTNCVFAPIDGKFPDFTSVIPEKLSGEQGFYNPHYLADFLDLVRTAADNDRIYYTLHHNGAEGRAAATSAALPDWVGVLMPMRNVDSGEYKRPDWI